MPTSKVQPAGSVAPAAKVSKSTKASAKKSAAAKAKTSNSPSPAKGSPRKARQPAVLPKSDGDAGVQAFIDSMEPWQAAIAKRVDAPVGKFKDVRSLDVRESDELDEKQLATWIKQAATIRGWDGGSTRYGGSTI